MPRTKKVAEETTTTSTTKKKGNGQEVIVQKRGQWSDPKNSLRMEHMFIELELIEHGLGTSPSDKELLSTYIASKAPDSASKAEEISALGEEEVEKKQTTIFMKGWFKKKEYGYVDVLDRKSNLEHIQITPEAISNGELVKLPYFWNYQLRGFFKDSCGLLAKGKYGNSATVTAYKKVIDGGIFVSPRRIAIELPEYYFNEEEELVKTDPLNLQIFQRPVRISGASGERTAICSSELIPVGSRIHFEISYTDPKNRDLIIEWLNYGCEHGLGCWRNSGRGSFIWREVNSDYSPIVDD